MNNFKQPRRSNRQASVDGFIRRPPGSRRNINTTPTVPRHTSLTQGFSSPDGFNPRGDTSQLPDGSAVGRRPVKARELDMALPDATQKKSLRGKKDRLRLFTKKGFSSFGTVGIVLIGFLIGTAYLRATQVFGGDTNALGLTCDVDPERLRKEGDGRVNILLLGKGGTGHEAPNLTDTMMLASIDACQKEVGLLSIPRDLYVQTPEGTSTKINAVYALAKEQAQYQGKSNKEADKAGIQASKKVVENVTGMPIHYHALVDFIAFRKAIDTVGGIDINVKEQLYDPTVAWENNNNPVLAEKGQQHFDGKRALLYARSRYGSARGDFDRSARQREIMLALKSKVFSVGTFGNPIKLTQLFDAFGSHVRTNLSINNLMKLYEVAQEVNDHDVKSLSLADPPNEFVTTTMLGGLSVVIPKDGLNNYASIHTFLRTKLRDGFLKKEDARIAVLNGTSTPGLATTYATTLKGYGYKVTKAGNAPSASPARTQIIDHGHKDNKYTRRYLELRFKTSVGGDLPDGFNGDNYDFVIILGANETSN